MRIILNLFFSFFFLMTYGCGGYKAADADDLEPRPGEIVGVLVNGDGKATPDATIQLFAFNGISALSQSTGIDSDGRFGVFPPESGTYNIVGSIGDLDKGVAQNIQFEAGGALNIGTVKTQRVAGLTVQVNTPEGVSPEGVLVEVLGFAAQTTTIAEGAGVFTVGIPAGTWSLRFSRSDLATVVQADVTFAAEEVKILNDIELALKAN